MYVTRARLDLGSARAGGRGRRASLLYVVAGVLKSAGYGEAVVRKAKWRAVCRTLDGGSVGLGMQWLSDLPFADNRVLQIGFLAACGIAALVVLALFYRLVFAHRLRVPGGRTRQPRLGLVDAFSLDGQRQLVLVRRDNVEHLVMIGGPNDVLIEPQINRAMAPARENSQPSPLLAPGAPGRRSEAAGVAAPVAAEAPPTKVAASLAASSPAAASAAAPSPTARPPPRSSARGRVPRSGARRPAGSRRPAARRAAGARRRPRERDHASSPADRAGARSPRLLSARLAAGRTTGGAHATGAGEFAAAAPRPDASGDASADRPG